MVMATVATFLALELEELYALRASVRWISSFPTIRIVLYEKPELSSRYCTFFGNALTWWNSHMKAVTQDVAYAMDWKTLKKMMTEKYYPRGEIKKLEVELWNLKVKGTDVASYTLHFQELALMCGRIFHEESEEVEKYVGGLPDMIRGNGTNNKTRGRTLGEVTLLALVRRGSTRDHCPCVPNATITTKDLVLPGVISARRSAIWLVTVGVLAPMVIITTVGTPEQLRTLALAMSVVFRGISRMRLHPEVENGNLVNHRSGSECTSTRFMWWGKYGNKPRLNVVYGFRRHNRMDWVSRKSPRVIDCAERSFVFPGEDENAILIYGGRK
ncbi:reverse transcriptase domain-containing protein [Tanacetum coccineum]